MTQALSGKHALVTGGGRGIGRGHCIHLGREGAAVVVNDVDGAEATRRIKEACPDVQVIALTSYREDDLVQGRRQLPWRVRMAISRLRKDLRLIPLYAAATRKRLQEVKEELLHDITRPLRRPEFLKELRQVCAKGGACG